MVSKLGHTEFEKQLMGKLYNSSDAYLERRIHKKFCEFCQINFREPTHIILSEADFVKFEKELWERNHQSLKSNHTGENKYNGMLIIRSKDVFRGEIMLL